MDRSRLLRWYFLEKMEEVPGASNRRFIPQLYDFHDIMKTGDASEL
ncbi:MAG: hypothetical protein MZU95_14460 [Desulfomicrobium escambiense]|nr:hypothetical protein [Desulfomicrobium escambiense]